MISGLLPVASGGAGASYFSNGDSQTRAVGTHIGHLSVVNAFLPQPASPAVAAIYLTVKNSGSAPDFLVAVSSAAAGSSMLMSDHANGTMSMLMSLHIPPHGQASLVPGRDHLMLQQPRKPLHLGQHVSVALHFRHAGILTISVPVVPLSRILEHGNN